MKRILFSALLCLAPATSAQAGELDKEIPNVLPAAASMAAPSVPATEMDRESPQQAWHRWGAWGRWGLGYYPSYFAYANPVGFYAPQFYYPPVVSYGWGWGFGGYYSGWYGYPAWGWGW